MIKRIVNPEEFCKLVDDMREAFPMEHMNEAHALGLTHDHESIKNNFANKQLLNWDFFVWANKNENKFDACISFFKDKSVKFNYDIFSEFVWLSKNPKVGFKLLKEAIRFARENEFKFITLSCLSNNPNAKKIERFYEKLGFNKDSTTYIAKL